MVQGSKNLSVRDPLLNPLLFFLTVIMKEFTITTISIAEIQNLVVNPKSQPVKSNSEQYQFLFKYISTKNLWQNFSK